MAKVHTAFFEVMKELGAIAKAKHNTSDGKGLQYAFRGIDQIYNELHPLMAKHDLATKPEVLDKITTLFEKEGYEKKITRWLHVELKVKYHFFSSDGSSFEVGPLVSEGLDNSDKASNKALSAAHKYALLQSFMIPTEDIEDGDNTTPIIETKKTDTNKATIPPKPAQTNTTQKPVNHAPGSGGKALSEAQVKRLWAMTFKLGWSKEDTFTSLKQHFKVDKPELLKWTEYDEFTKYLQAEIDKMNKEPGPDEIPF